MQKIAIIFVLMTLLVAILITSACKKEEIPGTEYTIPIDSIIHPDTLKYGEVLTIKYYGILGLSECFTFYRMDVSFDENIINTAAIGLYNASEDCTEEIYYLDGQEASIYSLTPGDFIIKVNLPRGSTIESTLHISEKQ